MKLEKAIEIQRTYIVTRNATLDPDIKDAINLGIEAITAILNLRQGISGLNLSKLPGETDA